MSTAYTITEVLTSVQLSFLRRVAAAGCVSIVIPDDNMVLNELVARKLVLGNQLTDAGWKELGKARDSHRLIQFALPQPNDAQQAAQEGSTPGRSSDQSSYSGTKEPGIVSDGLRKAGKTATFRSPVIARIVEGLQDLEVLCAQK